MATRKRKKSDVKERQGLSLFFDYGLVTFFKAKQI